MDIAPGLPSESDTHRDARALLQRCGHNARRIVQVNPDSILWTTQNEQPMIGWVYLTRAARIPRVFVEPGMPAYPTVPLPADHPDFIPEPQDA